MVVQPDGIIRFIEGCRLDKDYKNTVYFGGSEPQERYFRNTAVGIEFTRQSYQRYADGVIILQASADSMYKYNYLMFRNVHFSNKWFYAFVTKIEYVNNNACKIYYEIDVIQTWFIQDCVLMDSFVVREHPLIDTPGSNLIPENLECGDLVYTKIQDNYMPFKGGEYDILVCAGTNKTGANGQFFDTVYSNVFCGIDIHRYDSPSDAYAKIQQIVENREADSVVCVTQVPRAFFGGGPTDDFFPSIVTQPVGNNMNQNYDSVFKNNPMDNSEIGYTPKNKKLYTQPYFGILVTNSSGGSNTYAYEYFSDPKKPRFGLNYAMGANPECSLSPLDYKGVSINIEESLLCKDFPQCAFSTDSYKEYLARNAGKLNSYMVSSFMGTGGSAISGEYGKSIRGIAELHGKARDITSMPPRAHGTSVGNINYERNTVGFIAYRYQIRKEYAKIIDKYFDVYGYATNTIKVPAIATRPHWNYIKTDGCNIIGKAPAEVIKEISNIFDKGLTFWSYMWELGDYSLNNHLN